jgi:hypothetical protein
MAMPLAVQASRNALRYFMHQQAPENSVNDLYPKTKRYQDKKFA